MNQITIVRMRKHRPNLFPDTENKVKELMISIIIKIQNVIIRFIKSLL